MEYDTVTLPDHLREGCDKGSWLLRNARFRRAVCDYLQLKWFSISGDGNCFFESVCMCLRSVGKPDLTAAQLRADVVQYLRLCPGSTQDLPERICAEMIDEISEPLVCSTRGRLNGVRLNGFVPGTVAEYLDASACDSVWVRGLHWLRAVSYLHEVRVAVVINDQLLVRHIGAGEKTIHLYKVDAETHYEPLLPVAYAPQAPDAPATAPDGSQSNAETEEDAETALLHVTAPLSPTASAATQASQCTLSETAIIISSDQSSNDLEQFTPAAASSSRRTARMQCKRDSSSSSKDDDIAPSPKNAGSELLPRLRPRRPPVQHSSSESEATDSGVYSILFKESALQCRHSDTPSYTTAMQSGVAAQKSARRGTSKKSTHFIPSGTNSVCFAV